MSKKLKVCKVNDGHGLTDVKLDEGRLHELEAFVKSRDIYAIDHNGQVRSAADANEAMAFAVSQLAYTEAKVVSKLYTKIQFRDLLPITSEAGEWAETVRFETDDGVGQMDFISEGGDDMPTADIEVDEVDFRVRHAGISYQYTLQELRRSAYLKRPLNERRMSKAVEASERFFNKIALRGDTSKGMLGLLNQTRAAQAIAVTGKWDLAATTPDQILVDANKFLNDYYTASGYNFLPTDMGIPPAAWNRFVSQARTSQSDTTILEFLKRNNICKSLGNIDLNIFPLIGAETAGAATTGGALSGANSRCVLYTKDPSILAFHIPMPLRFQAPQLENLKVKVPGEARVAGLELKYGAGMAYLDNVLTAG